MDPSLDNPYRTLKGVGRLGTYYIKLKLYDSNCFYRTLKHPNCQNKYIISYISQNYLDLSIEECVRIYTYT